MGDSKLNPALEVWPHPEYRRFDPHPHPAGHTLAAIQLAESKKEKFQPLWHTVFPYIVTDKLFMLEIRKGDPLASLPVQPKEALALLSAQLLCGRGADASQ